MESLVVPKASPAPLPEVAAYLAPLAPLFRRPQSRHSLERYVTGLLTDLPRKNCQAIAAAVAGTSTERLQHLLTDADWDPAVLDAARVRRLAAASPASGVLIIDDTGLAKQGRASAGVARQYSGTLGKVGNCQVVVSAEYAADAPSATRPLHWPVTARLYLPEPWADDADRRERAAVPSDVGFATKPVIALDLVDQAVAWGVPFAVVVADANYGSTPTFLDGLEARGLAYVAAVDSDFGLRWPDEVRAAAAPPPPYGGRGRPRRTPLPPRHTAAALAATIPDDAWRTASWRAGTAGPLRKRVAALRLHRGTGSRAGNTRARITTGPEAGSWSSAPSSARRVTPSTTSATSPPTPHSSGWSRWRTAGGPSSSSTRTPRASAAWPTTRAGAGTACTATWRWRCWPTASWSCSAPAPPSRGPAFPPSGHTLSLPAAHRQILVWLLHDLVLWLVQSGRIRHFRPRRN